MITDSCRKTSQHSPWREDDRNRKERNEKGIPFPERTLGIAGTSKKNPAKKEWNGTERRDSPEQGVQNCRNQKRNSQTSHQLPKT